MVSPYAPPAPSGLGLGGPVGAPQLYVDTAFSKFSNLKNLCRLVFALLKSPLLAVNEQKQLLCTPDYWTYLASLYRYVVVHVCENVTVCMYVAMYVQMLCNSRLFMYVCVSRCCCLSLFFCVIFLLICFFFSLDSVLNPRDIHRALYPSLSSYGAVNNLSSQNVFLSRSAVLTSGCRLFLLDALSLIIIYYFDTSSQPRHPHQLNNNNLLQNSEIAFPPPKESKFQTLKTNQPNKQQTNVTYILIHSNIHFLIIGGCLCLYLRLISFTHVCVFVCLSMYVCLCM